MQALPTSYQHIYIAYSGGKDSHTLLHLAVGCPQLQAKITAVYVEHNLQSQNWGKHCAAVASGLGVRFQQLSVDASKKPRQSPEQTAREARYHALQSLLGEGDVLLLGQHQQDQLETVLLQLFRGAGVQGLAAMPQSATLGKGYLLRPLLGAATGDIDDYASCHNLQYIDDPSNQNCNFDRNFLRHKIIPLLQTRWQSLPQTVARSAKLCADSNFLHRQTAERLLDEVSGDGYLHISRLQPLDRRLQKLVLRQWFVQLGLKMPSGKVLATIIDEVINANPNANPAIATKHYNIRRYRQQLHCLSRFKVVDSEKIWQGKTLDFNGGILRLVAADTGICQDLWANADIVAKTRNGNEKFRLPQQNHSQTCKKFFQTHAIPTWERQTMPLIYINGHLAAIANLAITTQFTSSGNCWQITWQKPEFLVAKMKFAGGEANLSLNFDGKCGTIDRSVSLN